MQIFADEITQSFLSDGNVFIKLSSASGDVDALGVDIKNHVVTLIVPLNQLSNFSKNIQLTCDNYVTAPEIQLEEISDKGVSAVLFGQPLKILA